METNKFIVIYHGDPSVGIFPGYWELIGEWEWNDQKELEEFKEDFRQLIIEHQTGYDNVDIFTEEEYSSYTDHQL